MIPHILTILILIPLFAGLIVLLTPRQNLNFIRNFSVGAMLLEFLVSLPLIINLSEPGHTVDYVQKGYRFLEQYTWVESLGISYKVGIDGISVWLVLLTTALTPIALFASWTSIQTKIKEFAFAFLLLEVGMIGAFLALDLFLFYIFWELMLVPMYLIIGIWGGKDRIYAAVKFFLYTMAGSVLMLIAILYVVAKYKALAGHSSFDLDELMRVNIPLKQQYWLFGAFALAFAIKVPMFPVHTWLPDAHVQAPTGGSVILAAVLLKLGCYGFLRFAMPLFPAACHFMGPTIAVLAVVGIVYGAFCAWSQKDVKKLVAYSSVSHLGFVMLGLFTLTTHGITGAILQMVSHGVSTGALFLLVGVIYERRHTRELDEFGGLAKQMPLYAVIFVTVAMSSVGLPGTNGFIGEFMILNASFMSDVLPYARVFTMCAATGVVLAAIYMLHAVLKMFWGPLSNPENQNLPDVSRRELVTLVPLLVLVFWIGFFPNMFLKQMEPAVNRFIDGYVQKRAATLEIEEPTLSGAAEAGLDGDAHEVMHGGPQ